MQRAEKELTGLHARLDAMAERLAAVLRESTPTPETDKKDIRQALTPLGGAIQKVSDSIRVAVTKVESLIQRLEL